MSFIFLPILLAVRQLYFSTTKQIKTTARILNLLPLYTRLTSHPPCVMKPLFSKHTKSIVISMILTSIGIASEMGGLYIIGIMNGEIFSGVCDMSCNSCSRLLSRYFFLTFRFHWFGKIFFLNWKCCTTVLKCSIMCCYVCFFVIITFVFFLYVNKQSKLMRAFSQPFSHLAI